MRNTQMMLGILLALALVLSACAVQVQAPQESAINEGAGGETTTFTDANGLFTAEYPAGWYLEPNGFTERFGMPFPNVALGTSKELIDLSSAEHLLPEGEIGVGLILMSTALCRHRTRGKRRGNRRRVGRFAGRRNIGAATMLSD